MRKFRIAVSWMTPYRLTKRNATAGRDSTTAADFSLGYGRLEYRQGKGHCKAFVD
jgi:hypothetical protein